MWNRNYSRKLKAQAICGLISATMVAACVRPLHADGGGHLKCAPPIAVTFKIYDTLHKFHYGTEVPTIEARLRSLFVRALGDQFPHLEFTERAQNDKLEIVLDTGLEFREAPVVDFTRDTISLHFRLTRNGSPAKPTARLEFRKFEDYRDPLPDSGGLIEQFSSFLDEFETVALPQPVEARDAADVRFATLFDAVLKSIPILPGNEGSHLQGSKKVVISATRHDFSCSLPNLSEFEVSVELKEDDSSSTHRFRTRLIDSGPEGPMVTEAIRAMKPSGPSHLEKLALPNEQVHVVLPEFFLAQPATADPICRIQPEDFNPGS